MIESKSRARSEVQKPKDLEGGRGNRDALRWAYSERWVSRCDQLKIFGPAYIDLARFKDFVAPMLDPTINEEVRLIPNVEALAGYTGGLIAWATKALSCANLSVRLADDPLNESLPNGSVVGIAGLFKRKGLLLDDSEISDNFALECVTDRGGSFSLSIASRFLLGSHARDRFGERLVPLAGLVSYDLRSAADGESCQLNPLLLGIWCTSFHELAHPELALRVASHS